MADDKNKYILSIHGMSKSFGRNKVLNNIDLNVKPGSIMGLMGENGAGKSTMMKCLFGTYQKDEGTIILDGKEVNFSGPKDALENGVAMVHQELNQCLERSVVDNLFLGRYPKNSLGVIDEGRMKKEASDLFRKLGITVNLTQPMKRMSVSQRQMCEIAKAISHKAEVIIFDEPSAALTEKEIADLFEIIRDLRKKGLGIVYISHRMDEIKTITDRVTVMRDGGYVGTLITADSTKEDIINMMVGRVFYEDPKEHSMVAPDAPVVLKVENLNAGKMVQNVSFELRKGEILGFSGLMGAGRTELAMSIFGKSYGTKISGQIFMNGKEVKLNTVKEAIDNKLAYVTEDRKGNGLILSKSIKMNTSLANMKGISNGQVIDADKEYAVAEEYRKKLKTKCPSVEQNVGNLSGGNQQKVLLAKWMFAEPDILILDEPTRGIDVGAKYEIYCIINDLVAAGKSVIMISSELPEVLGMSDRIYIMNEGKFVGEVSKEEATSELIKSKIEKSGKGA